MPPKSPLTPLPRGFCGEALPHEDLSEAPRSNPLNEGTLLTGYGWGVSDARRRDRQDIVLGSFSVRPPSAQDCDEY